MSQAQQATILKNLKPADRVWFLLGVDTGLRISEILSIKWGEVMCDTGTKRRPHTTPDRRIFIPAPRMKGGKRGRVVWVTERLRDALRAYFPGWKTIFNPKGTMPNAKVTTISRTTAHRRLQKCAGISTHAMRKTFATHVYEKLNDILLTSIVLGHQDWKNTLLYVEGMRECDLWQRVNGKLERKKPVSNCAASGNEKRKKAPNI